MMIDDDNDGQMIFGDLRGLKLPDICLKGEEEPRKNLTQETCPDRRSNPGPLCDRCACYHLGHSGGRILLLILCSIAYTKLFSKLNFNKKLLISSQYTISYKVVIENITDMRNIVKYCSSKVSVIQSMWLSGPVEKRRMPLTKFSGNCKGKSIGYSTDMRSTTGIF